MNKIIKNAIKSLFYKLALIFPLSGMLFLNDSKKEEYYYFKMPEQEIISKNDDSILLGNPDFYSYGDWIYYFDTLKQFDITYIELIDKKLRINGNWKINISDLGERKKIFSLKGEEICLEKRLNFLHFPLDSEGKIEFKSENDMLVAYIENTSLLNGPFIVFPDSTGFNLDVRTDYGNFDPMPMKVILRKEGESVDSLEIKKTAEYPPYFISYRLKNKDSINSEDILWILNAYQYQKGNYFGINSNELVCADIITHVIKTIGLDYIDILKKNNLSYEAYSQRNIGRFLQLVKKEGLEDKIHYFLKNDDEKIFKTAGWENLIPLNFGIEDFKEGQLVIFARYFSTGNKKGMAQKRIAHTGIISELSSGSIKKVAMITSISKKVPYRDNILFYLGHDFWYWYDHLRSVYISDETEEALTYRVRAILDFPEILTFLKNKYSDSRTDRFK